jgi:SAM-dependent methyltransferase
VLCSTGGRVGWFAALYDPILSGAEAAFLRAWRAELAASVRGRVLEIGAGTGLNLAHYPADVDLVLTEPSPDMRERLAARAGGRDISPDFVEQLPFPDASFDVVVSTLVLCSVRDLDRAVAQIRRVLRPGGELRFIEHVGSRGALGAAQRALDPLWCRVAGGCHLCRDTPGALAAGGLAITSIEAARPWSVPPFLHPWVRGTAVRGTAPS